MVKKLVGGRDKSDDSTPEDSGILGRFTIDEAYLAIAS